MGRREPCSNEGEVVDVDSIKDMKCFKCICQVSGISDCCHLLNSINQKYYISMVENRGFQTNQCQFWKGTLIFPRVAVNGTQFNNVSFFWTILGSLNEAWPYCNVSNRSSTHLITKNSYPLNSVHLHLLHCANPYCWIIVVCLFIVSFPAIFTYNYVMMTLQCVIERAPW